MYKERSSVAKAASKTNVSQQRDSAAWYTSAHRYGGALLVECESARDESCLELIPQGAVG
jgi:hypothetical protein